MDQILNTVSTHLKVDLIMLLMDSHVIFDEYHEYANMDIFNLLFAELIECKKLKKESFRNTLLVSATPNYLYIKKILKLDADNTIEMPSFNCSSYRVNFIKYNDFQDKSGNFVYERTKACPRNTFVITNTAKHAQISFIRNLKTENAILFHSKFKKNDKAFLFEKIIKSFKKDGEKNYDILRSGPVIQASLNITCSTMFSEITGPENFLQRLGRLDRFGENNEINNYNILITEAVENGNPTAGDQASFLKRLNNFHSAKAWFHYLANNLKQPFKLPDIYKLYKEFYKDNSCEKDSKSDLSDSLKNSICLIRKKLIEPIKIVIKKPSNKNNLTIRRISLRGDSRFVQAALYNADTNTPSYDYACTYPDEHLTDSLNKILGISAHTYMKKKHHNICSVAKIYSEQELLENARELNSPIYLSYTQEDLNKVNVTSPEKTFVYYVICKKQPIGLMDYEIIPKI
ncbi:MAG: hypothetical protein PHF29_09830 [Candidatus Riflebacteria bacterium]|nr:hypothetical protein [Candidatus Riflebacteria bacterium]